ncbi:MAG: O-methyltransferase [Tunicatimonas sp.]
MNTALLDAYAAAYSTPETALLRRIRRETHLQVLMPQMLSGPAQGALLAALVRLTRARRVLEIGTFTGYASLWMAQALPSDGLLHTIDRNEELEGRVKGYFGESSVGQRIRYHLGDAQGVIPTLDETFDLVFIDADKDSYKRYYELIVDRVRENGLIVVDNVLWGGKVAGETTDRKTRAIREFNDHVHHDPRVANVLLPLRDGLMMLIKQKPT